MLQISQTLSEITYFIHSLLIQRSPSCIVSINYCKLFEVKMLCSPRKPEDSLGFV